MAHGCSLMMLLLVVLLPTAYSAFTAQCFTSKFDHAVSSSAPVAELWQVTLTDCLNYCIFNAAKAGDGCASVVFHREYSTCQLYGHDGTLGDAEVVSAKNHDYFNRTSYIGACQDRVVPKRGYQQRPRQYSISTVKVNNPIPLRALKNSDVSEEKTIAPLVEDKVNKRTELTDEHRTSDYEESPKLAALEELYDLEEEPAKGDTITFMNPAKTNLCSKREKMSYFVLFGYALTAATKPSRLKGVDQSSCIMYCSQNINSTGAKVPCYAANYDPAKEECRLYGKSAKTDRHSATLVYNENIIFADKFCIETKKDCSAESPYIVYMHMQMTKKIIAHYPDVHSIVACLGLCIDHGQCKAVTYKTGGLCIMHGLSPALDSSLIVPGTEQTMVIENGCQLTANTVPSLLSGSLESMAGGAEDASEWGEWSTCQFGSKSGRMRVRHRECFTQPCEDLQLQPCDKA